MKPWVGNKTETRVAMRTKDETTEEKGLCAVANPIIPRGFPQKLRRSLLFLFPMTMEREAARRFTRRAVCLSLTYASLYGRRVPKKRRLRPLRNVLNR